jgi:hypothetical protein
MRIKTIVILIVAILLTVIVMQNTGRMWFSILFFHPYLSKLFAMLFVGIVAFILGYLVGRPKRVIRLGGDTPPYDKDSDHTDTLSEEDRDYIS